MPGNSRRMPETKARSVANAYWGGRWFQFGSNSSITEQAFSNAFVSDGSVRIEPGTYTVTLKMGRWEGEGGPVSGPPFSLPSPQFTRSFRLPPRISFSHSLQGHGIGVSSAMAC